MNHVFAPSRGNSLSLSQSAREMKEGFLYLNCLSAAKQSTTGRFVIAIVGRDGGGGKIAILSGAILDSLIIRHNRVQDP